MSRWDRYVLRPRVWTETSRSETVLHIGPYKETDDTSDVILGTLPVNYVPTSVLFDLGASHSFMSETYALRHDLSFVEMSTPMIIQTPRSRWLSRPGVCVCNSCYNSII